MNLKLYYEIELFNTTESSKIWQMKQILEKRVR